MSEVSLPKNVKAIVDNCGVITLVADSGKLCFVHVHPADLGALVPFLVDCGCNFGVVEKDGG